MTTQNLAGEAYPAHQPSNVVAMPLPHFPVSAEIPQTSDVLIIGAGIAGLAAALALARYNHRVLVLSNNKHPGQGPYSVVRAFAGGEDQEPRAIRQTMIDHIHEKYPDNVRFVHAEVTTIRNLDSNPCGGRSSFEVRDSTNGMYCARKIILALGITYTMPASLPGYDALWGTSM